MYTKERFLWKLPKRKWILPPTHLISKLFHLNIKIIRLWCHSKFVYFYVDKESSSKMWLWSTIIGLSSVEHVTFRRCIKKSKFENINCYLTWTEININIIITYTYIQNNTHIWQYDLIDDLHGSMNGIWRMWQTI